MSEGIICKALSGFYYVDDILDFPTPEFPVKAHTLSAIAWRSLSNPSPVSALTWTLWWETGCVLPL